MEPDLGEEQFLEEDLKKCKETKCDAKCCYNISPVKEWVAEYFMFHDKIRDKLVSDGVKIDFREGRFFFERCFNKGKCSFLKHSPEGVDLRPIECKIYPYRVDWHSVDFDNKIVILFCIDGNCPLVKDKAENERYKKEVERIIKRDFALLFNGAQFEVAFFKDGEYE
jgi:hypothetical protein